MIWLEYDKRQEIELLIFFAFPATSCQQLWHPAE